MSGMNCRQYEVALMDLARREPLGAPLSAEERTNLAAHLETCSACRTALDGQMRLSVAASALATEAARLATPASVERALQGELQSTRRLPARRFVYGVLGGAIAASLVVAWWMTPRSGATPAVAHTAPIATVAAVITAPAPPVKQVAQKRHRRVTAPAVAEPEQPFIAIPYTLPLEPYERADVMRMDLPVSALIAAGFPTSMMDPSAHAQADVLVGQDGRARAIRLIAFSTSN